MFRFDGSFRGGSLLYVNVGWCGYCTKARPIMDQVSLMLGHGVPVYDVDGDVWREYLVSRLGEFAPKSYPTILFIGRNGDVIPYTGERTVDEIVAFACKHAGDHSGVIGACRGNTVFGD